jgi:exodeoxyribonuclease V beta subunit
MNNITNNMETIGSEPAPLIPLKLNTLTLPLAGTRVIEASAGTGKTWTLAALYVRIILGHGRPGDDFSGGLYPPQILVMTFTEAATAELRGRIRDRLAEAAGLFGDADAKSALGDDFLRDLRLEFAPDQWPACAYRLNMAAQWMDDAAIFTIHGWSSRMLRQHAFDSASLFEQSIVVDSSALKLSAARDYWRKWFYPLQVDQIAALKEIGATPDALLEKLEKIWAASDKHPETLVSAGEAPDVLIDRWQVWQTAMDSLESVARQAWNDDVVALVQAAASMKTLKNYRADWLQGWLNQMAEWSGGESIELKTIERFSVSTLTEKGWDAAGEHTVFVHIKAVCEQHPSRPEIGEGMLAHAAAKIGEAYRNAKAQLAQFDFSDLLQCLYHALQASDGRLAAAIRQQYPIALVDEFQDTDPWQYGALSKIYKDIDTQDTALLMIGDPKQAIYSFRGADLDTYLLARKHAQEIYTLSGNYRSTEGVVAAVNHVFSLAEKPFGEILFDKVTACNADVQPLQVGPITQPAMTVWHLKSDKPLTKRVFQARMANLFATQMVALLNSGAAQPGEMAVLVRSWKEARAIRQALSVRGVRSVYLSERDSVFDTAEATDLWRILRAVANPQSTKLLRAALVTRLWDTSWTDLDALFQDEDSWDALVNGFHIWQQIWQQQGILPMLYHLLHDQAIPSRLLVDQNDGERRLTNLLHLGDLLQTASLGLQGEGSLVRYLENQLQDPKASGDAAQLRLESDANLVQVITVHKAKGLQYPLVFLPFVSDSRAEKKDSERDDAERLAEDVRLLYVALTRAERALWLGVSQLKGDPDSKGSFKSALSRILKRKIDGDLGECLKEWAKCPDVIIADAPDENTVRYSPSKVNPVWQDAVTPKRILRSTWWMASFSAIQRDARPDLTSSLKHIDSERNARMEDAQIDSAPMVVSPESVESSVSPGIAQPDSMPRYNAFHAGSAYGTLMHDLLEWQALRGWPIGQERTHPSITEDWENVVARKSERLKLSETDVDLLKNWVEQIVTTPMPLTQAPFKANPLMLATLGRDSVWAEMAFSLSVHSFEVRKLDALIQEHVLAGVERDALQARLLAGMVIGFMDLVLNHEGRYYILDYKSNRLDGYDTAQLKQSILSHRYDVQYSLYLLALHRLLKSRLPDYDYDIHVGGAIYFFIRGIDQPGAGVFVDRPPRALIEAMDAAFSDNNPLQRAA